MNIRQAIFNRFMSRQPHRDVTYPTWKKVSRVFVLYESEWTERNVDIRAIVQRLLAEDKQVVTWGYIKKDKIQSPVLPENRVLSQRDFNWLFRPKSDIQKYLQRQEFDMLIDLTIAPVLQMQYVALLSQAKFKIGSHPSSLYDMVIQCKENSDSEYIYQQIYHYLTTIKSAD